MLWVILLCLLVHFAVLFSCLLCQCPAGAVAKSCNEHICLCVCGSVCLQTYLRNHTHDLYQFFCACCLWPWLVPAPAWWQNPKRKGQFWGLLGHSKALAIFAAAVTATLTIVVPTTPHLRPSLLRHQTNGPKSRPNLECLKMICNDFFGCQSKLLVVCL